MVVSFVVVFARHYSMRDEHRMLFKNNPHICPATGCRSCAGGATGARAGAIGEWLHRKL